MAAIAFARITRQLLGVVADLSTLFDPDYTLREVTHDPADYYLRKGEAPGRWLGAGAARLGLSGEVTAEELHDLFAGKDPRSGRYLVAARGSSTRARRRAEEAGIDVKAAAARLALSEDAVRKKLRRGELAGEKTPRGHWRIPVAAIEAHQAGDAQAGGVAALPAVGVDECYGIEDAARVAGVNRSYLTRLMREEPPDVDRRQDGRPVQYLVGRRDERGRWRIDPAELRRFTDQRRPPRAVPAYDLVLRAPKSVSVLHALGEVLPAAELARRGLPGNVAQEVLLAHHAAAADAIGVVERHAAFVRSAGGQVPVQGLVVAAFDHRSSRAGDPLLHSHHVIVNAGEGIDGRQGALDSTALFAWARTAGHVYQARLRHELSTRLGVEFEIPHEGLADVVGVPRAVIEEFSQRARQIAAQMARLGTSSPRAAQVAALDTRAAKDDAPVQSPEELAARAAAVGFGPTELLACLGGGVDRGVSAARFMEIAEELAGPDGLTARATRVGLRDALCGFASALPEGATAEDLEAWATRLLADGRRFVPVLGAPARRSGITRRADGRQVRAARMNERAYSTPELLAHEAAILAAHRDGRGGDGAGRGWGVAAPEALAAALAARPGLRAEQAELVRRVTTSGLGVEVVVGGPGTGKTFALGAAAEAWRASGLRVVGAALQGGAAEALADEADLDERHTLTSLLGACDRHGARYLEGAAVIVDEAGMADTRQLARLARYAQAAQAKLVLVGDPDQLPEVGAGGAFARLVADAGPHLVTLSENRRQVHAADRARLALVRDGQADAALASAAADRRLHLGDTADAVRERLLADWAADPGEPGKDKLLVAFTVAEAERLNAAARVLLADRLGDDAVVIGCTAPDRAVDQRELRVGDRVRATRNDWKLGIHTGRVGTVVAVDPERVEVTVTLDASTDAKGRPRPARTLTLGSAYLHEAELRTRWGTTRIQAPGLAHAYASTAHAVQGRTSARAYVLLAEAGLSRQAAYVALSRARFDTHLYGVTVPDPDEVARHQRTNGEPDPDDTAVLARAMTKDASQDLASAADPLAAEVADLVAVPPAWLHAERAAAAETLGAGPPLEEGLRQVRTALADAYGLTLEALECSQLRSAMTAALRVLGATPERLVDLMVGRANDSPRELDSALDPVAVLVWATRRHALPVLAAEARARDAADARPPEARLVEAEARARLRRLDSALARQRESRLAALEAATDGPVAALLGPAPRHPAGLRPWRRAAAAIVDYRDAVGLFDVKHPGEEPWTAALGPRPADPVLAAHHTQVEGIVADCRAEILLAEVCRHRPALPPRPALAVATLVERPLAELDAALAAARQALNEQHIREGIARAARRELGRAEEVLRRAATDAPLNEGRIRSGDGDGRPACPERAEAQHAVDRAAEALRRAEQARTEAQPATPDEVTNLEQAATTREARLRADVLAHPSDWMRADIVARTSRTSDSGLPDPARLAAAYGDAAVQAERSGKPAASLLAEVLGQQVGDGRTEGVAAELEALLGRVGVDNRGIGLDL
ncbi:MAG: MobF family relaxase [Actinomycetota bacterium]